MSYDEIQKTKSTSYLNPWRRHRAAESSKSQRDCQSISLRLPSCKCCFQLVIFQFFQTFRFSFISIIFGCAHQMYSFKNYSYAKQTCLIDKKKMLNSTDLRNYLELCAPPLEPLEACREEEADNEPNWPNSKAQAQQRLQWRQQIEPRFETQRRWEALALANVEWGWGHKRMWEAYDSGTLVGVW